ncbi:MAG: 4'-phosphopantetheinyl transferase superfamily protein [Bacillota bacterium]
MTLYLLDTNELKNPELFQRALATVDGKRRKKVESYLFGKDQRLSLGAGLLLAYFMKQHEIPEKDMVISETGKPEVSPSFSLYFNVSHAGEFVLFCSGSHPLGIDIEQIQPDYLSIAETFFTREERAEIFAKETLHQQEETFFRLWTLKESYMKATGLGFLLPLHTFSVIIKEGEATFLTPQNANQEFRLQEVEAPIGYTASVCVSAKYQGALPRTPTMIEVEKLVSF